MQSDALFRAAADQAPQVMWIVNSKGAVTYLNQAWYLLVGGEPPKWLWHEWQDAVIAEDVAQMRQRWTIASVTGAVFEGLRRVKSVDGSIHVLSYRATPVRDAQGQVTCWVGMDADITQIAATEAALRFANRELESFSYSVSHDLRTPLVTVQGFSTLLAEHLAGQSDEKAAHYLRRIVESVGHMGQLIDGLLLLSNVSRARLNIKELDLGALAKDILDLHRKRDTERKVDVYLQPALMAPADRSLMVVLLENLLGNAWKFTSKVAHASIQFEQHSENAGEKVFVVRDNGAGFDMAHSGKLFGAFQRLHSSDEFPGTGIGLATVHRIILRHGGRVWVESAPGKGTSIYFALPRHVPLK